VVVLGDKAGAAFPFLDVAECRSRGTLESVLIGGSLLLVPHGHVWDGKRGDALMAVLVGRVPA
jgi:hypothetical protein